MSCTEDATTLNPMRGHRFTIEARDPLTGAALTGLTGITGSLSSTAPGAGDPDGTPIANCSVSLTATDVSGQYSGTIDETVTAAALANLPYVWAVIDGPNIHEVRRLRVVWV